MRIRSYSKVSKSHDRLAPNRISNRALDNDVDRPAEQIRKFVPQVDHVPKIPALVRLKRHQNVRVARRPGLPARERAEER